MASDGAKARLSQLWQWPLLFISLGLFGYASYLFINPQPGLSIAQRIDAAQRLIRFGRPDAGIEQLNNLLVINSLKPNDEAQIHADLAEGLDALLRTEEIPSYRKQLIEQTHLALEEGYKPDAVMYRRLGESYEKLGNKDLALDSYRKAMALDPRRALHLQRKVIELQLATGDNGAATASLDDYLKDPTLANSERAWALGEKAQILIDRGAYDQAKILVDQSLHLDPDSKVTAGVANYRLGLIAYWTGDAAGAERLLRLARNEWQAGYPLDSDAACLLGKIRQQLGDPREASAFFQSVLVNDPESHVATECTLGRGIARVAMGDDDAGLSDFHQVVACIGAGKEIKKSEATAAMRAAAATMASRSDYEGALEALADEQALEPKPSAEFYNVLATYFEKRADQLQAQDSDTDLAVSPEKQAAEQIDRQRKITQLLIRAGDANLACSRALTVPDDRGHALSMWKAVNLYHRAGSLKSEIAALELFAAERPDDGQAPEALLRLGQTYALAGDLDKAIATLDRIQYRYPQSLAAPKAAIPLAEAYMAQGPEDYPLAEKTLLSVVENNPIVTPDAQEFHDALFELGQLYYRSGRYEEAIGRLREMSERYPNEPRIGQVLFLIADSYRKSAALLAKSASPTTAPAGGAVLAAAENAAARHDRLTSARQAYDADINEYTQHPPLTDLDKMYLKLSNFYRADCVYELGDYQEAIKLYDSAALRYQNDPAALGAYVQIVNAYNALGKSAEAAAANERAKWLLQHIPDSAFSNGTFAMPKEYWDQWLKWTGQVGMYAKR